MNNTMYSEKEFKIGSDFELHTLKKKDLLKKKGQFEGTQDGSDFDLYPIKKKRDEDAETKSLQSMQYMNMGFFLVTPVLLGVILGLYIDNLLHIRPLATVIFISLGAAASIYNLFRMLEKH